MKTIVCTEGEALVPFAYAQWTVEAFTEGDCWRLALALQEVAGLPVVLITTCLEGVNADAYWDHALNMLPDGALVDVTGVWRPEDLLPRWGSWSGTPARVAPMKNLHVMLEAAGAPAFEDVDAEALAASILMTLEDEELLP